MRAAIRCLLAMALSVLAACHEPASRQSMTISGQTMGTTYTVKVNSMKELPDQAALQSAIDLELVRINSLMSTYMPDSELSRFNLAPVDEWFPVSPDMIEILNLAREIHDLSGGSFDVTVGPLVNLWGFGPTPMQRRVPSQAEISAARERVGFGYLEIGKDALRKHAPVYVDLSAIAKGYGVDSVARLLDVEGIDNYLVEIGGEMRSLGVNDRGVPWRIAIERPDVAHRTPFRTVSISDRSVATSGDYRNFFEADGVRYSHTIDPVTGAPITHDLASVTVLAPTCALADGMATAIDVLGPERGLALAKQQNLAAFVIIKSATGFTEVWSPAFEVHLND